MQPNLNGLFYLCVCSPDHWLYYVNYLDCQIKRHSAGEGTKTGHSPITEAKDFIRHNKSTEAAKKRGRLRAPYLAELELTWKLREAKLEDVVDLGWLLYAIILPINFYKLLYIKNLIFSCANYSVFS